MIERDRVFVGAIEAGGTKFVCAVGTGPDDFDRTVFPTEDDPARLLAQVTAWLGKQEQRLGRLAAIGIGSFGPLDLDRHSSTYGYITSTPKRSWIGTDIVGAIGKAFPNTPIGFDTDVNAAALGERTWGNARGLDDFVYVTIGTGIGAGGMVGGKLIHGLLHPEMGHMLIPRVPGDVFEGVCPYHGSCWEGLCSGPALQGRAHQRAESIPAEHECWGYETQYIAYAMANIMYTLSPRRIILGGSVRKAGQLGSDRFFQLILEKTQEALRGYIAIPSGEGSGDFIVPPLLEDNAGICGAIALAVEALALSK